MLDKMVDKVRHMRPIPPCDDLEADSWGKVDKLIKKALDVMKDRGGVERPMHVLSEALFDIAARDANLDRAIQTTAYRALDTRLLTDEYGRLRRVIGEIAEGKREVIDPFFPPRLWQVPPSVGESAYHNEPPLEVLKTIAGKLRRRSILGGQGG
jgi:hypothetical protein